MPNLILQSNNIKKCKKLYCIMLYNSLNLIIAFECILSTSNFYEKS